MRLLPAALLTLGAIVGAGARPQEQAALRQPLETLPRTIDSYAARDLAIDDDEQRVAGMSAYSLREYSRDSTASFSVYVGYYDLQLQGKTIHSPKNCLPGSGWQALGAGTTSVGAGGRTYRVNRYVLTNGSNRALVYYWYQGRGRVESNEYTVKWELLRDGLLRGRTEEALVRIAIPLPSTEAGVETSRVAADELAARAASILIPAVEASLPAWNDA